MSFRPEPARPHGSASRCAVLLVNLGTPQAATPAAVRRYLAEFLSDPRVVEIPRLLWLPLLHGLILRTRPRRSAAKYASIWLPEGSPLAVWTARQSEALARRLAERGHDLLVRHAMRYGRPALDDQLDALRAEGAERVLVLPLYPQYSAATTATVFDKVADWARRARVLPEMRFVSAFHDHPGYIGALADAVGAHWREHGRGERLVLSFHGLPARSLALGDPYFCHCQKTARLLGERLQLQPEQVLVSFQSRFGRARWLEPYTEPSVRALGAAGVKTVDVLCPGFVADCLETLEEVAIEVRAAFIAAGGRELRLIPCLNDRPAWIDALANLCEQNLLGWSTGAPDPTSLSDQRQRALALGAPA